MLRRSVRTGHPPVGLMANGEDIVLRTDDDMDADRVRALVKCGVVPDHWEIGGRRCARKERLALKLLVGTGTAAQNQQINAGSEYPVN